MKRALLVAVVLAGAVVLADDAARFREAPVEPPYDAKEAFAETFDARALEVIRNAKHIEVFRLANDAQWEDGTAQGDGGVDSLDGFAVSRRFTLTDSMLVARLKTLTLNPAAYRWYNRRPSNGISVKLCGGFQPKVAFRFGDDPVASVDVLLCFNCEDIAVREFGKTTYRTAYDKLADMAMPDEWLALEKAAFPDDAYIQKQKLHGREPQPWSPDGGPF
jgi:hypothetical protein